MISHCNLVSIYTSVLQLVPTLIAKRLFVKGCFWYQVPAKLLCKITQTPTSRFWSSGGTLTPLLVLGSLLLFVNILQFRIVHLCSSLWKVLKCNLLPTHRKIKDLMFFFFFLVCRSVRQTDILMKTPEAVGNRDWIYGRCMQTPSSLTRKKRLGRPLTKYMQNMLKTASWELPPLKVEFWTRQHNS